ncbi:hypothetical protein MY4038_003014 [Beauveria bassiana]
MIALAQLLSPAPGQGSSDVTPVTRKVSDIRADQAPRTLNEQATSIAAALPNHLAQIKEPALPKGSAQSNEQISSSEPASRSDANTLADPSEPGASTSEQPQSDKPVPKQTIHYNGQKWEYKGYKWLEAGILSLELKLVASNGGTELVREIEVHRDNPEGLLGLWKATPRPEPSSEKYEPLQVVEKTEDGRYRMQWTGFDALENTSLEPPWRIRKIAPDLLRDDRDGDFCDLTIVSGPLRLAVHRVVVCAQSQVIRTACTGPWKEAASGVLEVKEWPAELVRRMVDYMYTGTYADWPAEANEQGDVQREGWSCFSEPMVFHANMVILADMYLISGLHKLAEARFNRADVSQNNHLVVEMAGGTNLRC